jgi:hypothetical protein
VHRRLDGASSTSGKDVDSLVKALAATGVSLTSILAEPRTDFTLPGVASVRHTRSVAQTA